MLKAIIPQKVSFKCLDLRKANWNTFAEEVDKELRDLPAISESYKFIGAIKKAARRCFPHGCKIHYILGFSNEIKNIYEEYLEHYSRYSFSLKTIQLDQKGKD